MCWCSFVHFVEPLSRLPPVRYFSTVRAKNQAKETEKIHGQWFALHPGMKIPLFFP
ncbi:hypothetical protein GS8_861 [Geobacillus stearothermophilus]|uniref:Uncharacterized protein n=1 Tax=Geobacillus stearothermophilus TaxID=1422 RepID=A0ABQ7HI26_GEOSE|nr:hypothetical protein GS8_861 [Geobacillus stearothermophilus]